MDIRVVSATHIHVFLNLATPVLGLESEVFRPRTLRRNCKRNQRGANLRIPGRKSYTLPLKHAGPPDGIQTRV